jgi:exoribonuclease-2
VRVKQRSILPEDESYLADVVALALEERDQSRTMQALGLEETPWAAHSLLLSVGYWDEYVNPYPTRFKVALSAPEVTLPELPEEERRDLTYLTALAIDDEGNKDPDDALSLDGSRLWVHIADVAALVLPDSEADIEARERSMNLYLPEGTVPMLPPDATVQLGLGLTDVSPALSFGLDLDENGDVDHFEIVPSWIRVTRLSYAEAEERLDEPLLGALNAIAQRFMAQRIENGAVELNFPEVRIRIIDGEIDIRRLPPLASRILVREAMLMAGQAAANYALEHEIPMPFTVQQPPDVEDRSQLEAETLSEMFAVRKLMKPGRQYLEAGPHSGLGLDVYLQVTSPLRRYFDLLVHQQLRAHVHGDEVMDAETVADRLAAARSGIGPVRLSERFSNAHWTVAYLQQHPDWSGTGIVVDHRRSRSLVIIPELAYETEIRLDGEVSLDAELTLQLTHVNLPEREARFRYAEN